MDRPDTSVIYITGFGRSGSSLVETMIAQETGFFSAGELCNLFQWAAEARPCTCGKQLTACGVWAPVLAHVTTETGFTLEQLDIVTKAAERRGNSPESDWNRTWELAFSALRSQGHTHIIDSSKTSGGQRRLPMLSRLMNVEVVCAVHVARSLGGVTFSLKKGSNRSIETGATSHIRFAGLKAIYGWWMANASAVRYGRYATTSHFVRYEQLDVTWPGFSNTLSRYATLQLPGRREAHPIAGNRMLRVATPITIATDERWRRELPMHWQLIDNIVEKAARCAGALPDDFFTNPQTNTPRT